MVCTYLGARDGVKIVVRYLFLLCKTLRIIVSRRRMVQLGLWRGIDGASRSTIAKNIGTPEQAVFEY